MRYLSLCSGIEAATVAWHPMGWEPAAFAEIEAFPAAVLKHHYPDTPNLGDMTKWREWDVGAVDLLVGGTPCQSFSVAGLRRGLSDPRGGLMLTFLEIAQSLRPRWVVWENVPGVLSSGGGRDFGSFLGALGELGYGWSYRVLDAQWCRVDGYERAVPQRRRRVFVVGCLGDATRAAKVLFERQSVERNPAPRGKARQGVAADVEDGAETGGCYWDGSDCAATLTKQNAGGGQRMPDKANFGAVLQPICIDRSAYNQGQNAQWDCPIEQSDAMFGLIARGPHAVAVPVADTIGVGANQTTGFESEVVAVPFPKSHRAASATDDESWVRAEAANTLNRFDTGERDTHAVAFTVDMQACKGNANIGDGSVSPTLCKPSGSDTHAIAFTPGNLSRGAGPSPNSEVAPTQKCSAGRGADDQRTCVAFTCKDHGADASHAMGCGSKQGTATVAVATQTVAPSLTASNDPSRSPQSAEVTQQIAAVHQATMVVRRLTPIECERLQGFPDDYTNIPWRGKPEAPDGPRYKALGNSMAVNCMRWIGRRIDAVEKGTELPP